MSQLCLFESEESRLPFRPLADTKPIGALRCGIFTLDEKWKHDLQKATVSYLTENYLQAVFIAPTEQDILFVDSRVIPTTALCSQVINLNPGESITYEGKILIARGSHLNDEFDAQEVIEAPKVLSNYFDLLDYNHEEIGNDLERIRSVRMNQGINDPHTVVYGMENVFVDEGAVVRNASLNALDGPIYIGKNATIHEGSIIRGPVAIGEDSHVLSGSRIRGASTFGPRCAIGGEIKNVIFQGYSNKGHDGYLGDSLVGSFCNFGAGTTSSNLKNNYSNVRVWDYPSNKFCDSGRVKFGLVMGDFTHTAIGTLFNTGTCIGTFVHAFGNEVLSKHFESFSWGASDRYALDKALNAAQTIKEHKGQELSKGEVDIIEYLFLNS